MSDPQIELDAVKRELAEAGVPIGDGERTYSPADRVGHLAAIKDYWYRKLRGLEQMTPSDQLASINAILNEARAACQEALGVLTEPGIMDVDEWKAWQKKTVTLLQTVIAKAEKTK